MRVLGNIGFGLFLLSIVSVVFWSPRSYSVSHDIDNAIDKLFKKEKEIWGKTKNIPSKINSATANTIGKMKIEVEDNQNLYKNSLTQTNEEIVKPTLNEISNWVGITKAPSTPQEHLNKAGQKAFEAKDASVEAGKHILDAIDLKSNDLKDKTYHQSAEVYKQGARTYDQTNDWIADKSHYVFDKSSTTEESIENEAGKIINTFQKTDSNTIEFPNENVSNIAGFLEDNVSQGDVNENNSVHNHMQLLGTNNIEGDAENATNVVHSNVRLLGVDNSNDLITKNVQELDEQWDRMSKDTGLNSIEQSFIEANNMWSTFKRDDRINEEKNKINTQKALLHSNQKNYYYQPIHHQIEKHSKDTKNEHEVSTKKFNHFEDDYYDDSNYEGVKDIMWKYSNDLSNKIGGTYDKYKPNNYYDYAHQYGEESYNDIKDKIGQHCSRVKMGYNGAEVGARDGTLYNGLDGVYEGAKLGANVGYEVGKHIEGAKDYAREHYNDGRYEAIESYEMTKNEIKNIGENLQYNEYNNRDDGENEDDKDYYEEL